jgi:EAL and modified HD-GYP domain-containing signal transduction protein
MEFFLGRLPIFDRELKVYAYELLFRSRVNDSYNHSGADDHATSAVLTGSFLTAGMETITRGKVAFINFTQNLLINELADIFPKNLMAVEVLDKVESTEDVIAACQKLKHSGYLLVLGAFVFETELVMKLADIIKVDFPGTEVDTRRSLLQGSGSGKVKFLADKLETREVFEQALGMGYHYFQGPFFTKPLIISMQEVSAHKLSCLRLLQELNQPELDMAQLEKIIKQDVTLSYKLLSYINSAFFGLPHKIQTIKHALSLLGPPKVKKWLSLIALSSMGNDKTEELVVASLIRAHFCELMAPKAGLQDRAAEVFLMGLFSMLDALLDQPMPEILAKLPISEDIKLALLGDESVFSELYGLLLVIEKGDWGQVFEHVVELKLAVNDLSSAWLKALDWSYQITA